MSDASLLFMRNEHVLQLFKKVLEKVLTYLPNSL